MKIYSKFHDYYDSVRAWGADPKTVYIRKTFEFLSSSNEYQNIHNKTIDKFLELYPLPNQQSYGIYIDRIFLIIFCGHIHPCIVYQININWEIKKTEFCYDIDSVSKFIKKYGTKKDYANFNKPRKVRKYYGFKRIRAYKESLKEFYDLSNQKDNSLIKLHCDIGYPVFIIEPNSKEFPLVYNPILKDYKFYKVSDVHQTFQELSMFISGIMGGTAPPMVEISDKIRLEKHGFDSKLSFRKEKQVK